MRVGGIGVVLSTFTTSDRIIGCWRTDCNDAMVDRRYTRERVELNAIGEATHRGCDGRHLGTWATGRVSGRCEGRDRGRE